MCRFPSSLIFICVLPLGAFSKRAKIHIALALNSAAITSAICMTVGFFSATIFSAADFEHAAINVSRSRLWRLASSSLVGPGITAPIAGLFLWMSLPPFCERFFQLNRILYAAVRIANFALRSARTHASSSCSELTQLSIGHLT